VNEDQFIDAIFCALQHRDRPAEALDMIQSAMHQRMAARTHTDHLPLFAEA